MGERGTGALSTDKPVVLAEMFRGLVPGRIGSTDVVAQGHVPATDRTAAGSHVRCIAGVMSRRSTSPASPLPGSPMRP